MKNLSPEAKEAKRKIVAIMQESDSKIPPGEYMKLMDEVIKECQTRSWVLRIKQKNT